MSNSVLKPGWQWVKFGDVVRKVSLKADPQTSGLERYVAGEHMDTDDLRLRRWGEISDNYLGPAFQMHFKPGQVLYGSRRTYLRKIAVPDFEGICANTTFVLESKDPNVLLPELVPFIMQTEAFHTHSISQSKGSVNPYVNFSDLAWYEFALPPLEAQRQMVSLGNTANELVESRYVLDEQLELVLRSASTSFFGDLIAKGVRFRPLAELCTKKAQSGIYKSRDFYGSGTPVVHMNELFGHNLISTSIEMQLVQLSENEIAKYSLTDNDLLFGRRSIVLEGAGRCVLVRVENAPVAFESSLLRVTLDSHEMCSDFVYEWFRSPIGQRYIQSIRTFTTVAGVKGSDVDRLPVPLISLQEQQRIVTDLRAIRESSVVASVSADTTKRLSSTLINRLSQGGVS